MPAPDGPQCSIALRALSMSARRASEGLHDEAAAEDRLALVQHHGLARGHGTLRLPEEDPEAIVVERLHARLGTGVRRANPGDRLEGRSRRRDRDPVGAGREEGRAVLLPLFPDHDAVAGGVEGDDVEAPGGRQAEPLPLTDRVAGEAGMPADDAAGTVDDLPRHARIPRLPADELGVPTVRYEADVLALRLVGVREAAGRGQRPHRALGELADREDRPRQLLLRQAEQEIRLVLGEVARPEQAAPPARRIAEGAGVVTGRDARRAERRRAPQEVPELRAAVTMDARNRRAAGPVLGEEVGDHLAPELLLQVEDVERYADP